MRTNTATQAASAVMAATVLMTGCSSSGNPVQAQADAALGGLGAGSDVQVTAALTSTTAALKDWQLENSRYPNAAEFVGIPGAAVNGGATLAYVAAGDGFCLTATSSGKPTVVRIWREPGGLQPAGATC